MSFENPYSIDTDFSSTTNDFAATSGRVGVAPLSTQGGRAQLFKSPSNLFSLANVDASGNQIVSLVNPAGNSLQVYSGQTSPAAASQYGSLMMTRQNAPTPVNYQPVLTDSFGGVMTAGVGKTSFRTTATGVTCAANKVLFSIFNAGAYFIRIASVNIYVPSQGTLVLNGGTLLGVTGTTSTTTYYPLFCETYRISSHTKGSSTTQLSPAACDTGDTTLDSNVTVYSGSTISSSLGLLHRRDALQCTSTGVEYYRIICGTERNILCRPGEGIAVVCVSSGTIAANTNNGTTTASVDVGCVFTQATA